MPDDDLNPNSGTHDEKENPSETPLPQSSPASIPTANPERKPADHKKARLFTRIWRIHRKRQRRVSPPNVAEKITVFLILVTAGIGGIQARIYHQQKKIMESSGHQTDQLIAYAKAQACAAKSFAASAAAINTGIGDAVGKLNLQADKLEKSVRQAARLAKATEEANSNAANADRPWIGAFFSVSNFESGKAPTYTVTYINSGRRQIGRAHV